MQGPAFLSVCRYFYSVKSEQATIQIHHSVFQAFFVKPWSLRAVVSKFILRPLTPSIVGQSKVPCTSAIVSSMSLVGLIFDHFESGQTDRGQTLIDGTLKPFGISDRRLPSLARGY